MPEMGSNGRAVRKAPDGSDRMDSEQSARRTAKRGSNGISPAASRRKIGVPPRLLHLEDYYIGCFVPRSERLCGAIKLVGKEDRKTGVEKASRS